MRNPTPRRRGSGDHDMRFLILASGGRSRLCPSVVRSKESVQTAVVAKVPGVAILGQGQVADSLALLVVPEALNLGSLVTKNQDLGKFPIIARKRGIFFPDFPNHAFNDRILFSPIQLSYTVFVVEGSRCKLVKQVWSEWGGSCRGTPRVGGGEGGYSGGG